MNIIDNYKLTKAFIEINKIILAQDYREIDKTNSIAIINAFFMLSIIINYK